MQPDEFFKIFDSFITSMADAKEENERIKKQREEEERRAQLEEKVRSLHFNSNIDFDIYVPTLGLFLAV